MVVHMTIPDTDKHGMEEYDKWSSHHMLQELDYHMALSYTLDLMA